MNKYIKYICIALVIIITYILYKQFTYYSTKINVHPKKLENYYKKKKVAILISGQIRDNSYQCLMTQKTFIIDFYNADVFCSFSNDVSDKIKSDITRILNPKYIKWEDSDNKYNIQEKYYHNTYLMFKKIYLCNKYKLDYEKEHKFKYDLVIRIRPDLLITSTIPKLKLDDNTIYFPQLTAPLYKYVLKSFIKITDQIAFSNSSSMDKYSNIHKYFINILKKKKKVLPEIVLAEYLNNKKINIELVDYKFCIYKYCVNVTNKSNEKLKILYTLPSYFMNAIN